MAKVTILIEGIGLIYQKTFEANPENNRWKVLFPFDRQHRVKFIWRQEGHTNSVPLASENGKINIIVKNPDQSNHAEGTDFDKFLDINSVHTRGIKEKDDGKDSRVLLTIPNAKLSCDNITDSKFFITKNGATHTVATFPKQIGYSASAEINLGESGSVTVEAKNANDDTIFSKLFSGQDFTLKFDNNCLFGPPTEITDFEMLYDIIQDVDDTTGNPRKKFSVERVEKAKSVGKVEIEKTDSLGFKDSLNKILSGDILKEILSKLGILNTDLEPFVEGVPCHMATSSDSSKLP